MGCWNGTCMISNLPINVGDRTKLVLIRKSSGAARLNNSSGYVYSTDVFTPSFFPLTGLYDDYGMIESIEKDWNYYLIEKYFKQLFGEKIIADGETKTDWTLFDVLNGIERHDLKYYGKPDKEQLRRKAMAERACEVYDKQGYSSDRVKKEWEDLKNMDVSETWRIADVSFVLIREDIWNHIAHTYKGEFYNRDAKRVDDPNFYLSVKDWCAIEFQKGLLHVERMKKLLEEKENVDVRKEIMELLATGGAMNIFTKQNLTDFIQPELYDAIVVEGDKKQRKDILERFTEFTAISAFLGEVRRGWMLQPGLGSQHDGWETHLMLAEKIVKICKEEIKEFNENN